MLLKNLIVTALILAVSYVPAAFSQSSAIDVYPDQNQSLAVNESNLFCFQNLECLKAENPFKNSDLSNIKLNGSNSKYVIKGSSRNEQLYAEYDGKHGSLIAATVIQRNVKLPKNILVKLNNGEYSDWTMVSNTRVIKNFNNDDTRYEVVLMKNSELRTKYYDSTGMIIDPII